jgi:hypothetical protein
MKPVDFVAILQIRRLLLGWQLTEEIREGTSMQTAIDTDLLINTKVIGANKELNKCYELLVFGIIIQALRDYQGQTKKVKDEIIDFFKSDRGRFYCEVLNIKHSLIVENIDKIDPSYIRIIDDRILRGEADERC